jgi:hypothetical protein
MTRDDRIWDKKEDKMDPETALRDALEALLTQDRESAVLHLSSLATWLEKGGFMPRKKEVEDVIGDLADEIVGETEEGG